MRGFTLIELIVAVAIVGILAAVGYPAYTAHIRRGKIASALSELSAFRVRLEQYYQDNRDYGSSATGCGIVLPSAKGFAFSCQWDAGGTPQSFIATATGQGSDNLSGYVYTVNNQDQQKTVTFDGANVNLSCWIQKKGDSC